MIVLRCDTLARARGGTIAAERWRAALARAVHEALFGVYMGGAAVATVQDCAKWEKAGRVRYSCQQHRWNVQGDTRLSIRMV